MKRFIFAILCATMMCGCGNNWEITKKNFKSDFGDLERHVVVYDSWSNKTLWEYTGFVYLRESGQGNYSFMYYDEYGTVRKNDYIGNHIAIMMEESITPSKRRNRKSNKNYETQWDDESDDETDDETDDRYTRRKTQKPFIPYDNPEYRC